jgi:uncharacterized protein YabN with tetrapyrrole methylase and pyrophosphatase domain
LLHIAAAAVVARFRAERPDEGIFHELPPGLPALAYAAKAQKRAASAGFAFPDVSSALDKLDEEVGEVRADPSQHEVGDVIFAAVAVARAAGVDPEIAVRAAAARRPWYLHLKRPPPR